MLVAPQCKRSKRGKVFEKFCPNIHGMCRDGMPNGAGLPCIYWDSLDENCIVVKSFQYMADTYQAMKEATRVGQFLEAGRKYREE